MTSLQFRPCACGSHGGLLLTEPKRTTYFEIGFKSLGIFMVHSALAESDLAPSLAVSVLAEIERSELPRGLEDADVNLLWNIECFNGANQGQPVEDTVALCEALKSVSDRQVPDDFLVVYRTRLTDAGLD